MPDLFDEIEIDSPVGDVFDEIDYTPEPSQGFGYLKVAEQDFDREARRTALLDEQQRARFDTGFANENLRAIETGEQLAQSFSSPISSGIHGIRQGIGIEDPNNPKPIVPPIPRTNAETVQRFIPHAAPGVAEAIAGTQQAAAGLGDFLFSPDFVALGGAGAVPKLVKAALGAAFSGSMAQHLPEQAGVLGTSTVEGKPEDVVRESLNTGITILGAVAPIAHSALPKAAKLVESKIKVEAPGESKWSTVPEAFKPKALSEAEKGLAEVNARAPELIEKPKDVIEESKIEEITEAPKVEEEVPARDDLGTPKPTDSATAIPAVGPKPEIVGMGGAVPAEFVPPKKFDTSIQNAVVDKERADMGLPPAMQPLKKSFGDVWDEAMAIVENDPKVQDNLVAELRQKPRPLTDVEDALLTHRQADLKTEQAKAARDLTKAFEDGRADAVELEQAKFDRITNDLKEVFDMGKMSGTENARGLNARKMMADQDFNLSNLILQKRAAKGGKPLTTQETVDIQKISDDYKALTERFEKSVSERDQRISEMESQRAYEKLLRETQPSNYVIQIAEKIVSGLEKRATKAEKELRSIFASTTIGADPTVLLKVSEIAAYHIAKNGLDFAKWSASAISKFGDSVKPYLEESFSMAQKLIEDQASKFGGRMAAPKVLNVINKKDTKETIENAKARVESGDQPDIRILADKLSRQFIEQGIKGRDAMADAVHGALKEIFPDISIRETKEAISGYGVFRELSKDEVEVQLRDNKAQLQLLLKLEDMAKGEAPKMSGFERGEKTDIQRQLTKQVEEAKRKGGYTVTDPAKQLKSAMDSIKTRLRNSITDLETQIASREKIVKSKSGLKYDKEAEALKARRDELKKEFDDIFGKRELTDEQRTQMAISAVERSITELERKIDSQDYSSVKKTSKTKVTPELQAQRSRRDALKEQLQELRDLANPKKTPEERANQSFKTRTRNKIADLEERMAKGDFSKKKPREYVKDKEAVDLKYDLDKVVRKWNQALFQDRLKNLTAGEKIRYRISEALLFQKAWKTAFDLSAIFRQGAFVALGNPLRALKIMPDMFRALKSEKEQFRIEEEIRSRPNAHLYEQGNLFLSGHGEKLSKMEEAYLGRWSEKVPLVSHSSRAYTTFLNRLRADSFDALMASLSKDGKPTRAEIQAIGNFVNVATGRGSIGPQGNFGTAGINIFFAPRYVVSRFQLLGFQPLYRGSAGTRKLVAKEYAKFLIGVATVYGLARAAGADIELDRRSPDFGKIKWQGNVIDPLGGLSQQFSILGRIQTGEKKNTKTGKIQDLVDSKFGGPTVGSEMGKYVVSKLSPLSGTAYSLATRKNFDGTKITPGSIAESVLVPINISDAYKIMRKNGIPEGQALWLLNTAGMGVSPRGEDR